MRKTAKSLIGILLVLAIFLINTPLSAAWLVGWNYRKKITIQHALVDGDLTDFPLYVDITADGDIGSHISDSTDGFDIRFTLSDGTTLLKYEREDFSIAGNVATGYYWVKVPSILAASGAEIYCYYGSGVADGEDAENVWDANYKGVWHMKDATTSTILDSTANNEDGTKKGANEPLEVAGKIYKAQRYDRGDDFISVPSVPVAGLWTVCALVKTDNTANTMVFIGETAPFADLILLARVKSDGDIDIIQRDSDGSTRLYGTCTPASDIRDGAWHSIIAGRSGTTTLFFYIDGGSRTVTYTEQDNPTETLNFTRLGCRNYDGSNVDFWEDDLCEIRVSNTNRSAGWCKFVHYNIFEGDNELTWESEEGGYVPNRAIMIIGNK